MFGGNAVCSTWFYVVENEECVRLVVHTACAGNCVPTLSFDIAVGLCILLFMSTTFHLQALLKNAQYVVLRVARNANVLGYTCNFTLLDFSKLMFRALFIYSESTSERKK